jgi:hypothetical protein
MLRNVLRWMAPPAFEGDKDKTRAAILLNIILWISIAVTLFYNILLSLILPWNSVASPLSCRSYLRFWYSNNWSIGAM